MKWLKFVCLIKSKNAKLYLKILFGRKKKFTFHFVLDNRPELVFGDLVTGQLQLL
jgi:hypothetical protein